MENAGDALKMAFAVIVFVMALSISIYMFTEARTAADLVLHKSDITRFMDYIEGQDVIGTESRIVGLETIIPTLYKYYKENYTVIFRERNGQPLEIYRTKTNTELWSAGYINKYYENDIDKRVCSFDVDEETRRHEPWTGNTLYYKQNLDAFLSGGKFYNPNGNGMYYDYSDTFKESFIEHYRKEKFIENLGEYTYNATNLESEDEDLLNSGLIKEKKKRVIIYTLH